MMRFSFDVRGENGNYLSWPRFDLMRWITGQTDSHSLLSLRQKIVGYTMMVASIGLGILARSKDTNFLFLGVGTMPAILGMFWLKRHENFICDTLEDQDNLRGDLEKIKTRTQKLEFELSARDARISQLELEIANISLNSQSADEISLLEKFRVLNPNKKRKFSEIASNLASRTFNGLRLVVSGD